MGGSAIDHRTTVREQNRQALYSIGLNVVLTALKGFVGVFAHSDALLADAAHSGADVAGSLAVWVGLRVARRPADADHPYGHGKAEWIAASLVAVLLLLAGLDVVYASIHQFFKSPAAPEAAAFYTAVFAIAAKEVMYRYQASLARRLDSPALLAGAKDHRSDVYSSLAAAAGILLAVVGNRIHVPALLYADPIAGLIVALVVVWIGYRLASDSFTALMDKVLDAKTASDMLHVVEQVPGVLRIDDLRARSHGPYVVVDVKVSVDAEASVLAGHHIAKTVKTRMMEQFGNVSDVLVHVNPFLPDERSKRAGDDV
ncbi:MAG: cation diffusion facilitator family transporter [Bacilli bacterium]